MRESEVAPPERDVPLAPLTTLRIGPVAAAVHTCRTAAQTVATVAALDAAGVSPLLLGGGSNVVLDDTAADLTVVRLADDTVTVDGGVVRAGAGAVWDDVVQTSLRHGLGGLECLSGIPGSAGATPVQNVGAYGVEVADVLSRVRVFDRGTGDTRWVPAADLGLGYRTSAIKRFDGPPSRGLVVLEVEFALDVDGRSAPVRYGELARALGVAGGERTDARRVREAVLALRRGKGMVSDAADADTWSVGSFFVNPVVTPEAAQEVARRAGDIAVPTFDAPDGVKLAAAWLVAQSGFGRGFPDDGPARLSTKHTLALTNRGGARTADVLALARTVRDGVAERFAVTLHPEPTLVGCRL